MMDLKWMLMRSTSDSTPSWAANYKSILYTLVMLLVTFAGRHGGRWYLRRKGVNPDTFMKSFWGSSKKKRPVAGPGSSPFGPQQHALAAQRAKAGAIDPKKPLSAEQRQRILAKTDHYLKVMDDADREEGRPAYKKKE
jgi:hypothetical protein